MGMADEITNGMLLGHIQAMKNDLQRQIASLDTRLSRKIESLEGKFHWMHHEMQKGFEEARQHREALQEDLNATIHMVAKHERKLARS
jgi:hypothetical protein